MRVIFGAIVSLVVGTVITAAAPGQASAKDRPIRVVATFSILADLAARVGGDRVTVSSLVGPDGDVHVYKATPKDAEALRRADLVIENGLALEGWIDRLISASAYAGPRIVASARVKPRAIAAARHGAGHHAHDGHAHGSFDPHAWLDPRNASIYADTIRDGLCSVEAAGCDAYRANALALSTDLAALHNRLETTLAAIPQDRRTIVTNHAALGYFAEAYGLTAYSPVGASTEAEPSAGDVARLVRQLKGLPIGAVFVEHMTNGRLLQQVARETGARLGGTLYLGSLSAADGPAATYLDMMRHNGRTIAEALTR